MRRAALLLLLLLSSGTVLADRLHLASGGVVDVDSWWIEGQTLHYRNGAGTVGLPRSLVVRVERDPDRASSSSPTAAAEPLPDPVPADPAPFDLRGTIESGQHALEARRFREAADHFELAMRHGARELVGPRVGYAVALLALREDRMAESVVLEGLALEPAEPLLLELLGDVRDREERVVDALESWRRAEALAPNARLRDKIGKAERELAAGRDYELSTTSHFNVLYDGDVDAALGSQMMEFLETSYWELAERFDHTPRQPITVLVYPTRQFRSVTGAAEWVGGIYDGKIRVPLGGLRRLDPAARAVLLHELAHAFIHVKARGDCPRWLHEGLAQLVEGRHSGRASQAQVRSSLEAIEPHRWEERGFSYESALSLTAHLESRRGFSGIVDMLELLGAGLALDEALAETYGLSYERLCNDWARELRNE